MTCGLSMKRFTLSTGTFSSILSRRVIRRKHIGSSSRFEGMEKLLSGLDLTQVKLLQEECILVDEEDRVIGKASKKDCHLLENINKGMLHRAFSVFLFNTAGELLLQQRATSKITFPEHFTNTCCSHPLYTDAELEETDDIGVKRAAQRRLQYELGIPAHQVPVSDMRYMGRVHYQADNTPHDGIFGEHEIDHVIIIQKDVDVSANENEVMSHRYVTQEELTHLLDNKDSSVLVTPWFKLIARTFLSTWWSNLHHLKPYIDPATIHRMI